MVIIFHVSSCTYFHLYISLSNYKIKATPLRTFFAPLYSEGISISNCTKSERPFAHSLPIYFLLFSLTGVSTSRAPIATDVWEDLLESKASFKRFHRAGELFPLVSSTCGLNPNSFSLYPSSLYSCILFSGWAPYTPTTVSGWWRCSGWTLGTFKSFHRFTH